MAPLASLLRADRPPAACLVCLRKPLESSAPMLLQLHEGGDVRTPQLSSELPQMRTDVLRALRSADEANSAGVADSHGDTETAAAANLLE